MARASMKTGAQFHSPVMRLIQQLLWGANHKAMGPNPVTGHCPVAWLQKGECRVCLPQTPPSIPRGRQAPSTGSEEAGGASATGVDASRPMHRTQALLTTTAEGVWHWTHPPHEVLQTALVQFLAVIYRDNPESTRTKLSMCKNTCTNASGYISDQKSLNFWNLRNLRCLQ